jgi:hypothetical protein
MLMAGVRIRASRRPVSAAAAASPNGQCSLGWTWRFARVALGWASGVLVSQPLRESLRQKAKKRTMKASLDRSRL